MGRYLRGVVKNACPGCPGRKLKYGTYLIVDKGAIMGLNDILNILDPHPDVIHNLVVSGGGAIGVLSMGVQIQKHKLLERGHRMLEDHKERFPTFKAAYEGAAPHVKGFVLGYTVMSMGAMMVDGALLLQSNQFFDESFYGRLRMSNQALTGVGFKALLDDAPQKGVTNQGYFTGVAAAALINNFPNVVDYLSRMV